MNLLHLLEHVVDGLILAIVAKAFFLAELAHAFSYQRARFFGGKRLDLRESFQAAYIGRSAMYGVAIGITISKVILYPQNVLSMIVACGAFWIWRLQRYARKESAWMKRMVLTQGESDAPRFQIE
jgi:hypothetical protein